VQAPPGAATGHPAAPVAVLDQPAEPVVHRAPAGEDVHGGAVALHHHPPGGVAGQVVPQRAAQQRPEVQPGPLGVVGIDVEDHLEAVGRQAPGALHARQGRLGHVHHGVGPSHPVVGLVAVAAGAAGRHQGVAGRLQGRLHHGALVGRQQDASPTPAPASPSSPAASSASGPGPGAGGGGATVGRMRRSWLTVQRRASSVTRSSWAGSTWAHTRLAWSSLNAPSAKAAAAEGSCASARAMATRRRARAELTPARRATQCSGDTMPSPCQPAGSSSAWAMAATTSAVAALSTPMAAHRRTSGSSQRTSISPPSPLRSVARSPCGPGAGYVGPHPAGGVLRARLGATRGGSLGCFG